MCWLETIMMQNKIANYEVNKEIFKDYLLRDFIGKGRYGSVYLVENRARKRALKVFDNIISWERGANGVKTGNKETFFPEDSILQDSTAPHDIHICNDFHSPYVVDVIDYGETVMGQSCVLMEYISVSLEQALAKEGRFSEQKACLYLIEILKGLELQEKYGIVHRDIKPANLFVIADIIKAGDHAFINRPAASCKNHEREQAFGTPAYSAPEVFDICYSHSTDRWAATVIFFQMLTGTLPFYGETVLDIMLEIMENSPDYTLVPQRYLAFLQKCFQKNPRERHSDAKEMLCEFKNCLIVDRTILEVGQIECKDEPVSPTEEVTGLNIVTKHDQQISSSPLKVNPPLFSEITPAASRSESNGDCDNNKVWNLRKTPVTVTEEDFKKIFNLDENGHPVKYIQNRYKLNDDSTIMDNATGLMWQQSGSEINFSYEAALEYVNQLNNNCFAGYSDWRIPTIAELVSLLEPEKTNGYLYISPLFDGKQQWCWSCDKRTKGSGWYIFFYSGNVNWDFLDLDNYVRGVRM